MSIINKYIEEKVSLREFFILGALLYFIISKIKQIRKYNKMKIEECNKFKDNISEYTKCRIRVAIKTISQLKELLVVAKTEKEKEKIKKEIDKWNEIIATNKKKRNFLG